MMHGPQNVKKKMLIADHKPADSEALCKIS